mgnify:CR=1 FL=1
MNANRLYPGMRDGNLEIFFLEEEDELKAIKNGTIKDFDELENYETQFIAEIIDSDKKLKSVLDHWWPDDFNKQIRQVAKCRFGGLNHIPDVTSCGSVNHDYINCSFRGNCRGENIVCKPIEFNGQTLSHIEVKAIQLLSTDMKNTVICQELRMAEGTFQVFRTRLYLKLGNINTKQELTRIGVQLGIS